MSTEICFSGHFRSCAISNWEVSEHHWKQTVPYLLFRAIPTHTSTSLQLFNSGISKKKHILSCHKTSYLKPLHATSGQKEKVKTQLEVKAHLYDVKDLLCLKMSQALFIFREHVKSHLYYAMHETSQRDRSGLSNTSTDPGSLVSLLQAEVKYNAAFPKR